MALVTNGDFFFLMFMLHTFFTQEITSAMKDWGYTTEKNTPANNGDGQVALSVAVVYPSGGMTPDESAIYEKSTIIFNYWSDYGNGHNGPRDIGLIAPLNNSDYEIERITVTNGYRDDYNYLDYWTPSDSITWEKVTTEGGGLWYNETEYWNAEKDGGVPMLNGASMGITWSGKNTAKLILIYVKPIEKDTNLNVVWHDDSGNNDILTSQIVVSSETEKTFVDSLEGNKEKPVPGQYFTLDDDAYVMTKSGSKYPLNKDLTVMQDIADQYRSGLYKYAGAELSEDGKTLTLGGSCSREGRNLVGDLSAVLIHETTFWSGWFRAPRTATAIIPDFDEKCVAICRECVGERITAFAGVPSWNLAMMRRVLEYTGKRNLLEV